MANFNGSEYLAEALDSILSQSYRDFECIVVDDGSTDASPRIIQEYAAKHPEHIRPLLQRENRGQGVGFNVGVAAARGALVAFVDSDDLWMPHKLERVQEMAERHPDAAFYCHNLFLHMNGAPTERRFRELMAGGDVFGHVKRTGWFPLFVPTSGLVFRKDVLDKVLPIPDAFRTCADGYLTRTSMLYGRVEVTDECWGYYRKHDGNQVFGNAGHNAMRQRYTMLLPALNAYYARQKIDFRFPIPAPWELLYLIHEQRIQRLKSRFSPRRIVRKLLS